MRLMSYKEDTLQQHCSAAIQPQIAILIPCFNEKLTIGKVIEDFKKNVPSAVIYVYDNNSSDNTAYKARSAGAIVIDEKRQGKGFVLQSMFMDIKADFYVLVDGDDTYPAERVCDLLEPLIQHQADMVVGTRLKDFDHKAFRPFHVFGNHLVVSVINFLFHSHIKDAMSGYRAFNRDLIRCIPIVSMGFEIETELTLQALYRNMIIKEIPIVYKELHEGSYSKLNTIQDGIRVLLKLFNIFKAYRPMLFFSSIGGVIALMGLAFGSVPIVEFLQTGKVLRFPMAILASALEIIAMVSFTCGILLDSINHHFKEISQLIRQLDYQNGVSWVAGINRRQE